MYRSYTCRKVSQEDGLYSRTPLIRPPSESHWCGRIRGMVAREGFRYAALLQQRHTKYGRIRGMVVGEGGRSTGVLLYRPCDFPNSTTFILVPYST